MRWLRESLLLLAAVLLVAQAGSTASLAAGVAVIAVGALLGARYVAVSIRSHEVTIGHRARQHRESFIGMPEPGHPSTPGRRRSRAPSMVIAAA